MIKYTPAVYAVTYAQQTAYLKAELRVKIITGKKAHSEFIRKCKTSKGKALFSSQLVKKGKQEYKPSKK